MLFILNLWCHKNYLCEGLKRYLIENIKNFTFLIYFLLFCSLWGQIINTHKIYSLKTGELFIPSDFNYSSDTLILFIHFHGKSSTVHDGFLKSRMRAILITIHLGIFSSPYQKAFSDSTLLDSILIEAIETIKTLTGKSYYHKKIKLFLTSFSAGYGAIREIIRHDRYYEKVDGIIILDGLHTDYVQVDSDRLINSAQMKDFLRFARDATKFKKHFILTHSEIIPEGYSSTTETAQYLIDSTSTEKIFSERMFDHNFVQKYYAINGNFRVFGFYGDTAKDHLYHLYNIDKFLNIIRH